MNEIIPVPDEYQIYYKVDTSNLKIIETDLEASNIILNLLNNKLFSCNAITYYKYNNLCINDF